MYIYSKLLVIIIRLWLTVNCSWDTSSMLVWGCW